MIDMKPTNAVPTNSDLQARARVIFDGWVAEGLRDEVLAVRIGCTSRSIFGWRKKKKISPLSARAIVAAAEKVAS